MESGQIFLIFDDVEPRKKLLFQFILDQNNTIQTIDASIKRDHNTCVESEEHARFGNRFFVTFSSILRLNGESSVETVEATGVRGEYHRRTPRHRRLSQKP